MNNHRNNNGENYQIPKWLAYAIATLFALQTAGGGLFSYFGRIQLVQIQTKAAAIERRVQRIDQIADALTQHLAHPTGHETLAIRIREIERRLNRNPQ